MHLFVRWNAQSTHCHFKTHKSKNGSVLKHENQDHQLSQYSLLQGIHLDDAFNQLDQHIRQMGSVPQNKEHEILLDSTTVFPKTWNSASLKDLRSGLHHFQWRMAAAPPCRSAQVADVGECTNENGEVDRRLMYHSKVNMAKCWYLFKDARVAYQIFGLLGFHFWWWTMSRVEVNMSINIWVTRCYKDGIW